VLIRIDDLDDGVLECVVWEHLKLELLDEMRLLDPAPVNRRQTVVTRASGPQVRRSRLAQRAIYDWGYANGYAIR
jgi:hypothetical protein